MGLEEPGNEDEQTMYTSSKGGRSGKRDKRGNMFDKSNTDMDSVLFESAKFGDGENFDENE